MKDASMSDPIRWLHLSDFHVGMDSYAQRNIFKHIIDHVQDRPPPDLVFITGDIANRGKKAEYDLFFEEFLYPLLTDLPSTTKLFAVPGNHDIDRDAFSQFHRDEILRGDSQFFDPTHQGSRLRNALIDRFQAYLTLSENTQSPADWLRSDHAAFTKVVEIAGRRLAIVGINTAWLSRDGLDRHMLSPGVEILARALESTRGCDANVVLGHHPLSWLSDDVEERIGTVLGQHHAIYLCGHLHKPTGKVIDGQGRGFLTIQAGASFQARDSEEWVNGLMWGELDLQHQKIRLQPRRWAPSNRDWPIQSTLPEVRKSGDWWVFELPQTVPPAVHQAISASTLMAQIPEGWVQVDRDFLDERRKLVSTEEVIRYFDGSIPTWALALSPACPRREVVERLVRLIEGHSGQTRPCVLHVLGPGAEGKSTALMHVVATLIERDPKRNVLWRRDSMAGLSPASIQLLPRTDHQWLFVSDEGDSCSRDCFDAVRLLHEQGRGDVCFLLTSRKSDWVRAKADRLSWRSAAVVHEVPLHGLTEDDAKLLVSAWGQYGVLGLGRLAGVDPGEAVRRLVETAQRESSAEEGAFLGAMLSVRIGETLKEHVRLLLTGMEDYALPGGRHLLDALAYIAAMHAENLLFLTKLILARTLNCQESDIQPRVLRLLGREALVPRSSQYVLTRHRRVAEAVVEVLRESFEYDTESLFVELARAAQDTANNEFVANLYEWHYTLPTRFFDQGNHELAIRLAGAMLDQRPNNIHLAVSLGRLLRKARQPEQAVVLFRMHHHAAAHAGDLIKLRKFFFEWGVAEGVAHRQAISVCLNAISLADRTEDAPINNEQAKLSLASLGVAFRELYEQYHARSFVDALGAIANLGMMLTLDEKAWSFFESYLAYARAESVKDSDLEPAMKRLVVGLDVAWKHREDDPEGSLPVPRQLDFDGLATLLRNSLERRTRHI